MNTNTNTIEGLKKFHVFECPDCGSRTVQCTAWIRCNSDEVVSAGSDGPSDTYWCDDCENKEGPDGALCDGEKGHVEQVEVYQCPECGEATHQCATGDPGCLHCDACDWSVTP